MNPNEPKSLKTGMIVPSDLEMPKGHEKYSLDDKEKCPYFQISENTKNIPTTKRKICQFLP